ncbi:MAG: DUF1232 domain-containing protein [Candidatus Latescibacteria bacterium]|jgi:uncharacterized membrane protein YkvA (DUF1232 family)|nr:DUF1232 domain-containing protein [Candidatus Latescibacterota bacterium]MBT4138836.1 DUF1232 domain-containing protein [Candidatus Latescibacterota bacterium]
MIKQKLIQTQQFFKQNFDVFQGLYSDPRTPKRARWLLWAAIGYTLLPFDLIPDFIPVLGQLDDLVIVPLLIILAIKNMPPELYEEHRQRVFDSANHSE